MRTLLPLATMLCPDRVCRRRGSRATSPCQQTCSRLASRAGVAGPGQRPWSRNRAVRPSPGGRVARFPLDEQAAPIAHSSASRLPVAGATASVSGGGTGSSAAFSCVLRTRRRSRTGSSRRATGRLLVADFRANTVGRLTPLPARDRLSSASRPARPPPDSRWRLRCPRGATCSSLDAASRTSRVVARASGLLEGIAPASDDRFTSRRIKPESSDPARRVAVGACSGIERRPRDPHDRGWGRRLRVIRRKLRLVSESGMHTLASGLGNPSMSRRRPDFYVTEFSSGRLPLLTRTGASLSDRLRRVRPSRGLTRVVGRSWEPSTSHRSRRPGDPQGHALWPTLAVLGCVRGACSLSPFSTVGQTFRCARPLDARVLLRRLAGACGRTRAGGLLHRPRASVDHGRLAGFVSALGIATGGLVHVAAATIGLSSLLASSAPPSRSSSTQAPPTS